MQSTIPESRNRAQLEEFKTVTNWATYDFVTFSLCVPVVVAALAMRNVRMEDKQSVVSSRAKVARFPLEEGIVVHS